MILLWWATDFASDRRAIDLLSKANDFAPERRVNDFVLERRAIDVSLEGE
jgi:hypothetical protein